MPKGTELARTGCPYLGTPYSQLDCQAFVERCLENIGLHKNLAGSNAWFRFLMDIRNGWVGTPEECKALFGKIPEGAFLFILEHNGKEPEKYRQDGIGNASHIGIYTGMTGRQMVDLAEQAGNEKAGDYDFGNGAINSSSTRKAVATSKFAGKSINGGWNRVGLWNQIAYGSDIDVFVGGFEHPEDEIMIATTWAQNGTTVNMRKSASTGSDLVERIPIGESVEVLDKGSEWCRCRWKNKTGFIKSEFLIFGEVIPGEDEAPTPIPDGMIMVNREQLEQVYDMIGNLLGRKG